MAPGRSFKLTPPAFEAPSGPSVQVLLLQ